MRGHHLTVMLCVLLALEGCAAGGAKPENARPSSSVLASPPPAARVTPQNEASLYLNIIDGLEKQQRYGAALAFLDDFAARQRTFEARYWLLRGHALLGLGRDADAATAYARLDGTPLAAEGCNGRGRVAAAAAQWRAAAANFQKAVQGDPSNADFLNNLAFADMHIGENAAAAAYLRQAYQLAPGSDRIRNNLIIALNLSGDRHGADAILQDIKDGTRREEVKVIVKNAIASSNLTGDGKS